VQRHSHHMLSLAIICCGMHDEHGSCVVQVKKAKYELTFPMGNAWSKVMCSESAVELPSIRDAV
jgi:hypothetical protein